LLSGCALPISLAPFDFPIFSLISLFLLLSCLQDVDVKTGAFRAYLFGLGMYGVGVSWVYVSIHEFGGASIPLSVFLVLLFVATLSLFCALQGYLYSRFFRKGYWGVVLGFAAVWVAQEWIRTWFLTGFPWLFLGYGFLDTWLMGLAPVLGVLGMSFAVAVTAGAIYAGLLGPQAQGSTPPQLVSAFIVLLVWTGSWGLGNKHWVHPQQDGILSVSIVQGNIDQHTKWNRNMVRPILDLYRELSADEWHRDVIIWPEAAITLFRYRAGTFLKEISARATATDTAVITGIPTRDRDTGSYRNSTIGLGNASGVYHKRRLVPFGEYVPLESMLRGLIKFFDLPMSHNRPGPEKQDPITIGPWNVSTSICYEVVYGELVRSGVPDSDLLLTISNDTWFGASIGPLQHLQMARMRALENGRYLIRGTNNGVTAIVNELGQVKASLPQFEPGVLRGEVVVMQGQTPYASWGSTPILFSCGLIMLIGFYRKWRN
jgi:apolipoprotein N-acyltransferase